MSDEELRQNIDQYIKSENYNELYCICKHKKDHRVLTIFKECLENTQEKNDFYLLLSMMYARRVSKKFDLAYQFYKSLSQSKHLTDTIKSYMLADLSVMYYEGEYFEKDYKKAFGLSQQALSYDKNNHLALTSIGLAYYDNNGIDQNYTKAEYFLNKAYRLGNPVSVIWLLSMYNNKVITCDDIYVKIKLCLFFMKKLNRFISDITDTIDNDFIIGVINMYNEIHNLKDMLDGSYSENIKYVDELIKNKDYEKLYSIITTKSKINDYIIETLDNEKYNDCDFAYCMKAMFYHCQNDLYDKSIELLEKAKSINKNNSYVYVYLEMVYRINNKTHIDLLELLDIAKSLDNKNGLLYNSIGFYMNTGKLTFKKACDYGCIVSLYNLAGKSDMLESIELYIQHYNYTHADFTFDKIHSKIKENPLILVQLLDGYCDKPKVSKKILEPCVIEV
jgi:TPR repeat protein